MRALACGVALAAAGALAGAQPLGTAFTYQGRLTDGGNTANGPYDLQLALFDAASGGSQIGSTLTRDDVEVSNGLFTVSLDFGTAFSGARRWLELRVRPGAGGGPYTVLAGRQELTASPHAAFSLATPWSGVSGKPAGFADDVDNDSGGDITGVTAGTGLTGGGTAGSVSLGVDLAGSGSASTVARSDHDHVDQAWTASLIARPVFRVDNTASGGFADGILGVGHGLGQGRGVVGYAPAATGQNFGLWGQADSNEGRGVFGFASATTGTTYGVWGRTDSPNGYGVYGTSTAGSGASPAVMGESIAFNGVAIRGRVTNSFGNPVAVQGLVESSGIAIGVGGYSSATSGVGRGVVGSSSSSEGYGVHGVASGATAYAGYFSGNAHVSGTLSKGGGAFKIDHPLDPENKYLYHSFVESPDMMNIYNGNVTTGDDGYAAVELPEWFEALNRDFRYQLTVIGQFAQAIVAREVEGNAFAIRTDKPNVRVSWQVTGIRKDAFAEAHRIPVEQDKPERERGRYMHPAEHGQPREKGVGWDELAWLDLAAKRPD